MISSRRIPRSFIHTILTLGLYPRAALAFGTLALSIDSTGALKQLDAEAAQAEPEGVVFIDSTGQIKPNASRSSVVTWGVDEADEERPLSLAIVVARCEESLEWVKKLRDYVPPPFHLARLHVVEKCPGKHAKSAALDSLLRGPNVGHAPPPLLTVSDLRNVGSQLYGYVTHIIDYYNHLEDFTAFLSGTPESSFDLCNFPNFLHVAMERSYAGLGFHYSQGSTNGFLLMDSCPGRGVPLHDAGVTVGISGSQFIASRDAIRYSNIEVFHEYRKCFESLPEVTRPDGMKKVEWDQVVPGASECTRWEHYGHMMFGMPRVLSDQKVVPCSDRRTTNYPRLVMPLLAVLPLWSPLRLFAICLALIVPMFVILCLCNPSKATTTKLSANSVPRSPEELFQSGSFKMTAIPLNPLKSPVEGGS